ncbi:flagellar assembly protein FliW [Terrilactibacillus sp. S3-3]|nr:flagellar assembly protein FliW [Terrilactibacillus sp. S3-3]
MKQLKIESEQDVAVLVIVSVRKPFSRSTANLKAPVIINQKARLGKQFIFDESPYQTRQPLQLASVSSEKKKA